MINSFNKMIQNILTGSSFIVFGILVIIFTYKQTWDSNTPMFNINRGMKGYLGGVGSIILGIMWILGKMHW